MIRVRLIGEPRGIESAVQPIAAPIAGKHPPGPIAPMGRRRQPDDQQPCLGITETRQRLGPILLANIPARRLFSTARAPTDETRTLSTGCDPLIDLSEIDLHSFLLAQSQIELQRNSFEIAHLGRVQSNFFSAIENSVSNHWKGFPMIEGQQPYIRQLCVCINNRNREQILRL